MHKVQDRSTNLAQNMESECIERIERLEFGRVVPDPIVARHLSRKGDHTLSAVHARASETTDSGRTISGKPCQPRGTDARQTNAWRHSCAPEERAQSASHLTPSLFEPPNRKESHKNRFGRASSHPSSR